MPGIALLIAACSAAGFALSTSLQHLAAGRTPAATQGTHRLLAHLARRPWWVVGQLVALVAFALHALALRLGTLFVIQPLVVSGIVLAVPVSAALDRRLPSRGELGTVALTAAGLALFLVAARPTAGHPPTNPWLSIALTVVGGVGAGAATWWGGRCRSNERAAFWFGVASGVLFGLVASLVKLTTVSIADHSGHTSGPHQLTFLGLWSTWAVLVAGLSGVAVNQRAYRAARLSASMPVLNIVDVLVAVVFGVVVFGENPAHNPFAIAEQLVALACVAVGLRRLGRSELFAELGAPRAPRSSPPSMYGNPKPPISPARLAPPHGSRSAP
jgi:drug/metabolite transporter (DMT)-like permease